MHVRRTLALLLAVSLGLTLHVSTAFSADLQGVERPIPARLLVPSLLIDAPVEPIKVVEGAVEAPTGLWTAGLIGSPARLDGTGFNVFFGYSQFTAAGPGAFQYLDKSIPGQEVILVGTDGLHYRYKVVSSEVLPIAEALDQLYSSPPGSSTWIALVAWARYDPAIGTSPGLYLVKAVRSGNLEPTKPIALPLSATNIVGCPLIQYLPAQFAYASVDALGIQSAVSSTPRLTEELKIAVDAAFPGCEVEIKASLTLSDGSALALVGPIGQVDLDSLISAVDDSTGAIVDLARANMFAFVLFLHDGTTWGAYLPPLA